MKDISNYTNREMNHPIDATSVSVLNTEPGYIDVCMSKNAMVARSGFSAETILCQSENILECIGREYFRKRILKCEKSKGNKKSDVVFTFEDGTRSPAQLKNGTGGGRGWSFDRRPVDLLPIVDEGKELVKIVCLKKTGERKEVVSDVNLIKSLMLGTDNEHKPEHFIHTIIKEGRIVKISICSASDFMDALLKDMYETFHAKKTCIHLTPVIYLQRKGGGTSDHSPNHIQAKLRHIPDCMITIPINQTIP